MVLAAALSIVPLQPASSASGTGSDRVGRGHDAARVVSMRDRVITLTNNKRRAHGCHNLTKNGALSRAAQKHTKLMADTGAGGTLSHQLPGEPSFGTRFTSAGYRNWTLGGENVAFSYPTARAVVQGWMGSPPHRANILNCRFKDIGVGFARASDGTTYWTQDFGRR